MTNEIEKITFADALGVKICELLQVGTDKASTVVPDTLQQIVAWQIGVNSFYAVVGMLFVIIFSVVACKMWNLSYEDLNSGSDTPEGFFAFIIFFVSCGIVLLTTIMLITGVCPLLIKALTAPNLVIIEQLGGLVK